MRYFLLSIGVVGILASTNNCRAASEEVIASVEMQGTHRPLSLETRAGDSFDAAKIDRDVRRLWSTGRFDDIQVQAQESHTGVHLVFDLTESHPRTLRKIRFEPGTEKMQLLEPKGTLLGPVEAARIAAEVRKKLSDEGYLHAQVKPEIEPINSQTADLRLKVNHGEFCEIQEIRISGDTGLEERVLRNVLNSIRPRRIFPSFGPIWSGWQLRARYSRSSIHEAVKKLRSLYLSRGFFDAQIEVEEDWAAHGKVTLIFNLNAGPRHSLKWVPQENALVVNTKGDTLGDVFCQCVRRELRESEKRGELVFAPSLEASPLTEKGDVEVAARFHPSPAYRIGRITFRGHRAVSELTLRKAFPLKEGDRFDAKKLRKGLTKLGGIPQLQTVDPSTVKVTPIPDQGAVNLTIPLTERPRGYWKIDGPLGPLGAFGPLVASMGTRLPARGGGALELSTYSLTFSVAAWPTALAGIASLGTSSAWRTVTALQRPYVPGQRWTSGILVAPQLGLRGSMVGYGVSRLTEVARFGLGADSIPETTIEIPVMWRGRAAGAANPIPIGFIRCESPRPRFAVLRSLATTVLDASTSVLVSAALY